MPDAHACTCRNCAVLTATLIASMRATSCMAAEVLLQWCHLLRTANFARNSRPACLMQRRRLLCSARGQRMQGMLIPCSVQRAAGHLGVLLFHARLSSGLVTAGDCQLANARILLVACFALRGWQVPAWTACPASAYLPGAVHGSLSRIPLHARQQQQQQGQPWL